MGNWKVVGLAGLAAALVGAPAVHANSFAGKIFTVGGSPAGKEGSEGDGGSAVKATLKKPSALAALPDGGFLVADYKRIRRVLPDGTIVAAAGTAEYGAPDSFDDGEQAVDAKIGFPQGVAPVSDGGYLIADFFNNRILRVLPDGTIIKAAGSGPAVVGPTGNDEANFRAPPPGDNGRAVDARLQRPRGVAPLPDGGYLIAEQHRIRRVFPNGIIITVAGAGADLGVNDDNLPATFARIEEATSVASLPDGSFIFTDARTHLVRRVLTNGTIVTVAGTGTAGYNGDARLATTASLSSPHGVTVLPDGGFLFADSGNNRIRRVSPGGIITTVAGGGSDGDGVSATRARLSFPKGVAVTADGRMTIADTNSNRIRLVDIDLRPLPSRLRNSRGKSLGRGEIVTWAGAGTASYGGDTFFAVPTRVNNNRGVLTGGVLTEVSSQAQFAGPQGVSAMPERLLTLDGLPDGHQMTEQGSIFVADTDNNRIRKITADGRVWTVAGQGKRGYMIRNSEGGLSPAEGIAAVRATLNRPASVDALEDGSFFIADTGNSLIRFVDTKGIIKTVAGQLRRDLNGRVVGGGLVGYDDDKRATEARLTRPRGVSVVRPAGSTSVPRFHFLIADTGNHVVREVIVNEIGLVAGKPNATSVLPFPERAISVRDDVYISAADNAIYRYSRKTFELALVIGSPASPPGYRGDGGSVLADARLDGPAGLLATNVGLAFADTQNDRIREMDLSKGVINTVAGDGGNTLNRASDDFGLATRASIDRPADLDHFLDGTVVADSNNNVIRFVRGAA